MANSDRSYYYQCLAEEAHGSKYSIKYLIKKSKEQDEIIKELKEKIDILLSKAKQQ